MPNELRSARTYVFCQTLSEVRHSILYFFVDNTFKVFSGISDIWIHKPHIPLNAIGLWFLNWKAGRYSNMKYCSFTQVCRSWKMYVKHLVGWFPFIHLPDWKLQWMKWDSVIDDIVGRTIFRIAKAVDLAVVFYLYQDITVIKIGTRLLTQVTQSFCLAGTDFLVLVLSQANVSNFWWNLNVEKDFFSTWPVNVASGE